MKARGNRHGARDHRWIAGMVAMALILGLLGVARPAAASAPPQLLTSAPQLDFGWTMLGGVSGDLSFPVINTGPGPATGITIGNPTDPRFERTTTTCGTTLAEGASCTVSLRHRPSDASLAQATISVSSAGGGGFRVDLEGRPDSGPFPVSVTPTGFDFGPTPLGGNATRTTTVMNVSGATATFSVSTSLPAGPFTVQGTTCTSPSITLGSGAICEITWGFAPTAAGSQTVDGAVTITPSGSTPRTSPVELRGHGGAGGFPLRVDETRLDFGNVGIGGISTSRTVLVTNTSAEAVQIQFGGGAMVGFTISQNCSFSPLPAGATCEFSYRAQPTKPGLNLGLADVSFTVDGVEEHFDFRMTAVGTGSGPRVHLTRPYLDFGKGQSGVANGPHTTTVVNSGTSPTDGLEITNVDNADHEVTTNCPQDLAAGASCDITVVWTPSSPAAALDGEGRITLAEGGGSREIILNGGAIRSVHAAFVEVADILFTGDTRDDEAASTAALDAGTLTRRGYVTKLANSPEWVSKLVQDLYVDTLGREGDSGGVKFWVNRLRTGRNTVAQVAAEFYASSEYYNGFGEGDDTIWVTDLYAKLLGRNPDPGGLAYWVGQTGSKGRASVSGRMFQSSESRRTRVTQLYEDLLFRKPDPSGLNYWTGKVLTGGDIVLAIELSSSSEFLRLAQYTTY